MTVNQTRYLLTGLIMAIMLVACGEDDAGQAKSQAAPSATAKPAATSGMAESKSESMSESMSAMEGSSVMAIEDNGVVYQDEIYKNWPKHN